MKQIRRTILVVLMCTLFTMSYAQLSDIGAVLGGGTADAKMLLKEYITPYANSLGANLNGGWYNTAKPHKLGGFDLTFSISAAIVPVGDRAFNLDDLVFNTGDPNITVDATGSTPTAAGKSKAGPSITYTYDDGILPPVQLASYNMPKGTGVYYFPSPMIQAGVGLPKGTELMGRYMPQTKLGLKGGTKAGLWGIGLKHSISQWIPGLSKVPVFDMSLMGGYSRLSLSSGINVDPTTLGMDDNTTAAVSFEKQSLDMMVSGYTINLLLSADLKIICFYGGAGISSSKTNLKLNGYYPAPHLLADADFGSVTDASVQALGKNPIDIDIESKDGSATKPRLNVGFRLKFAVVTIHADYTYANYSLITAGLGISFR